MRIVQKESNTKVHVYKRFVSFLALRDSRAVQTRLRSSACASLCDTVTLNCGYYLILTLDTCFSSIHQCLASCTSFLQPRPTPSSPFVHMVFTRRDSPSSPDDIQMPADSSQSTSITITKAELDDLVKRMVNDAMKTSTEFFESKVLELGEQCAKQEREISQLTHQIQKLEINQNHLEQYSRRSHLRIYGLQITDGVNCKEAVAEFVRTHLKNVDGEQINCAASDIDAAHPLPLVQSIKDDGPKDDGPQAAGASSDSQQTHPKTNRIRIPAIIVRFHERDVRDSIIKARRSLKGKRSCPEAPKFRIVEDLTAKNAALLKRLQNQETIIQDAWTWEGKVFALRKGERKARRFDIFDA